MGSVYFGVVHREPSAVVFSLHCCHVCHFLPLYLYLKTKSDTRRYLQRCVSLEMLIYVHWWQLLLFSFFSPLLVAPPSPN